MTKYFVTGGTGFVGSELVDVLLSHGHQVVGLARSDASAKKLKKKGVEVIRGTLEDLDVLKKGAKETDATIHVAFIQDFDHFDKASEIDFKASEAIIDVIEGTGKVFVWTSALEGLPSPIGVKTTEDNLPDLDANPPNVRRRFETEHYIIKAAKTKGIRSIVVRLPPVVHGENDVSYIPFLIQGAKDNGYAIYANDGKSTWPSAHKRDVADLFRLAAEKGEAGKAYHAAAEEGIETKLIAEAVAKKTGLKAQPTTTDDLVAKLGFAGYFFGVNLLASSDKTRKELGWNPKELTLLEDIEENYRA